jgi:voltage-gated potassium channel
LYKRDIKISKYKIYFALVFLIFLLIIGMFLFSYLENWSYIDSFYFSTTTLTTIGFGDLVPSTDLSKLITSIFSLLGVGTFLFCLSVIVEYYLNKRFFSLSKHFKNKKKIEK